jgi:pimeloyl-ACP methyl ester carboxylesterase
MTEFERGELEAQADAIRIEVEAPSVHPDDAGAGDDGGEENRVPPASEEATPQPAPSPGKRVWSWLLRAVGVAGVLALTLNVFGVSLLVEIEPSSPELRAAESGPLAEPAIRPFSIQVPEAELLELRRRINATRWPDRETVSDQSQGVALAKLQELVRYWGTGYDWRKAESKLNSLPQFVTTIDGLQIHFLHVRSKHDGALPVILAHGWPGSVLELVKAIGPLTEPTAHGGKPEHAFDVVVPSMPGSGFSSRPETVGWGPERIARAWAVLMERLGYARYVCQGGGFGSAVAEAMAKQRPRGLLGIHVGTPSTVPPEIARILRAGGPAPAGLNDTERAAFAALGSFRAKEGAYRAMMATRPQTIGYALTDSPAGLAAWHYDRLRQGTFSGGEPERILSRDEILDGITFHWLTNSAVSSARLFWESGASDFDATAIAVPAAVTVFPGEIYRAPRGWAERAYQKLVYFHEVDAGGQFAAMEQPQLFARELRAGFASLR